jgi:hypothetical protein
MKKRIFILLLLILTGATGFAKVLEIPFNLENKDQFYLSNARIKNNRVTLSEGDAVYKSVFNSVFIPFEKSVSHPSNISFFQESVFGNQSGLFYESNNYLRFYFENRFDFGMVMEFWLKPFTVDNGTVLSTEYLSSDTMNRHMEVYFQSGKLVFNFENLFLDETAKSEPRSVRISSEKLIPLKEWHHHRITYNPTNGEINYYLDGTLVSQVWATADKRPGSTVMYLENPLRWQFVLGKGYRGLMDNFFLSANLEDRFDTSIYDKRKGWIHPRVLKFDSLSSIYDLDISSIRPKNTYLTLQYRSSTTPFSDSTPENLIPWKDYNLENPRQNSTIKTRYIQFRIGLYPAPDGERSPMVQRMRVKYNQIDIPSIPLGLSASSSEGQVRVSFRESPNRNIVAYKVYYGARKDEYWGHEAYEGASPILLPITEMQKAGDDGRLSFTLKGLELYKVYYIRITALSDEGLESEMSDEVSVRVRKLK